jgi:transposase
MFPRVTKVKRPNGKVDEYVQLVESHRDKKGRSRHHIVCSLGRKELLASQLPSLIKILDSKKQYVQTNALDPGEQAPAWGRVLAIWQQFKELGIESILDQIERQHRIDQKRLADKVLVLVANRLCNPSSEHGLARWLETEFICDRRGKRWIPEWRDEQERKRSKRPRVRVKDRQLNQWYRTLDALYGNKQKIEKELFLQLRELFSMNAEIVFYDLTSTYFEGRGPSQLARHGYSRDGKPRNSQVLVGVVRVDGWPIAHHVFEGNKRDSETVGHVLKDVRERFGLARVVFVGDRGMVTSDNIDLLRSQGQGYLVGLNRRRSEKVYRYIEQAMDDWIECPVGITASEKKVVPRTLVQEVQSDEEAVRVFVVHSDERLEYERAQREKAMEKVRDELECLVRRVSEGKLKAPEKIGAAAARVLGRNHGHRYFAWELKGGRFHYFEHPVNLKREQALEGKYLIQTEEKDLSAVEAVRRYKELMEVEQAFRDLKDVIEMRPIHHQKAERVQAHIFVAALALLIKYSIQRKLKASGVDVSANEVLGALASVQVVDIELGDGRTKRVVTRGTQRAQRFLKVLGITDRTLPEPKGRRKGGM